MTLRRIEHVGIVVEDLEAAADFFAEIGFEREGGTTVEGPLVDRIVGLEGVRSEVAMMQAPDGHGGLELIKFLSPPLENGDSHAPANTPGLRHILFVVDDIHAVVARLQDKGAELEGKVVNYEDFYWLCYIRGPEGIIVELAEKIG